MKVQSYLRPREKMAQRAVHALSDNELLQAIIGSGSARFPVSYIARRVQTLLRNGVPSLQTLQQVNGVGEALASRLVAVFELAGRLSHATTHHQPHSVTAPYVEIVYFDLSLNQLSMCRFARSESHGLLLHRICKQAILVAASRASVSFRYDDTPSESALDDLCFVRELYSALALFEVSVYDVYRQRGTYRKELM